MYGGTPDGGPGISPVTARALGALALDVGFLSGDRLLYNRGGLLLGWSLREANGTPGICQIEWRDGGNSAGAMLGVAAMGASGESKIWLSPPAVSFRSSVFMHVVSGACVGSVWVIPDD